MRVSRQRFAGIIEKEGHRCFRQARCRETGQPIRITRHTLSETHYGGRPGEIGNYTITCRQYLLTLLRRKRDNIPYLYLSTNTQLLNQSSSLTHTVSDVTLK